ncbi:MAG: molybdenum cofactor guanylyltransferase [Blastocatellia bacterium]|nr:molybdenum cofactor guanylyltransferase [Blastocatellia bacterium]
MIVAIQAGGRSLRMGEDKAWLTIDGRPMIEQVLTAARAVADRLAIVINPSTPNVAQYQQLAAAWQAEVIDDLHNYRGPLGGIETALRQGGEGEAALILACDLPFLSEEFLRLLAQIHQAEKGDLTVPLDETGRPQMLAAIYAATCLPPISAMLAADELKARLLQERVSTREVSLAEYAHLPNAKRLLLNVNTLEDYQRLEG